MKLLAKLLLPTLRKMLVKKLEENQDKYVAIVNSKLNIPNLDEEQEKKMFDSIYDALQEILNILTEK